MPTHSALPPFTSASLAQPAGTAKPRAWRTSASGEILGPAAGSGAASLAAYARAIHRDDRKRVIAGYRAAYAAGDTFQLDFRIMDGGAAPRWVTAAGAPRYAEGGEFCGYGGMLLDVTECYETLERLAASDAINRLLIENSLDLISHHAPGTGIHLSASPSFKRVLGYDPAELVGARSIFDYVHPDDQHLLREEVSRQLASSPHGVSIKLRARHRDGHYLWLSSSATVLTHPQTHARLGTVAVTRDITGEVAAADQLARLAEENHTLVEHSPDLIVLLHSSGHVLRLNPAATEILGYDPGELVGRHYAELLHPDDLPGAQAAKAALRSGPNTAQDLETRWIRKDGAVIHLSLSAHWSAPTQLTYVTGRDVTERYRTRNELQKSKDVLHSMLESIGDAFFAVSRDWIMTYANEKAAASVGTTVAAARGRPLLEIAPDLASSESLVYYQRAMETRANTFFETYWEPSGTWVEVRAYPNEDGLSVYFHDISARREAEIALRKSEQRFKNLFEQAGDSIFIVDADLRIRGVNQRACDELGYSQPELLGMSVSAVNQAFSYPAGLEQRLRTGQTGLFEVVKKRKDGSTFPAEIRISRFEDDDGEFFQAIVRDLTERDEAQRAVRESEQRLREVLEMTPAGYLLADGAGYIRDVNPALCSITGFRKEQLVGQTLSRLFAFFPWEGVAFTQHGPGTTHGMEATLRHQGGHNVHVLFNGTVKRDGAGHALSMTGLMTDITARKQAESRLEQLATHDTLTGLPNRALLNDRVQQMLQGTPRDTALAVMFIDLDRFKEVNDSFGHEPGDMLLREVARRLARALRPADVIARLGGDEFVVAASCSGDRASATSIARKLLATLAAPINIGDQEVIIGASIGISMYPHDAQTKELLFQSADTAMYRAKAAGRNGYCFFEAEMTAATKTRMALELSLRPALARAEFELHYQPRIDLNTMALVGMEALIRWNHPVLGKVSPMQFIPIAEDTGLIEPIGRWVLQQACTQTRRILDDTGRALRVSVNLSARQLRSAAFVDEVRAVLANTGLPPHLLELELTESALIEDVERAAGMLKELKTLGIKLAVDDFGTGYSGLAYLRRFPIDVLKLDRSFVLPKDEGISSFEFISAFVDLAHALKLSVVAEGVETREVLDFLRSASCDEAQGYFLARPLTLAAFEAFVGESSNSQT